MSNYYIFMVCHNCNREQTVTIPCGRTVKEHCEIGECPSCGCRGHLRRVEWIGTTKLFSDQQEDY